MTPGAAPRRRARTTLFATWAGITLLAACVDGPTESDRARDPAIISATIAPGAHNVLSAVVAARTERADSVRVRFRLAGTAETSAEETPAAPTAGDAADVLMLGLMPAQRYVAQVVAYGGTRSTIGEPLEITTGQLPLDLPRFEASGSDASPGYVVFGAGRYGVVIDNTGRVVWYRHFPNGPGLAFMAQRTGSYVARPPTPDPTDVEQWVELDAAGAQVRTMGCARGLVPRLHDLILEPDGSHWVLCDETRMMDLTPHGGIANARVMATVVQRIAPGGAVTFEWSAFDHFAITDLPLADRTGENVNFTHGNAIDLLPGGDILLSFRSLGEITRIDGTTGAVKWRMGGTRNEFTFIGEPVPAFRRQHGVRALEGDRLVLLDNLGNPTESRAEHYEVNEAARVARLVQSYGSSPAALTEIGGSVQPLPGGRTLVSFGTAGRVEEYDISGRLLWRIQGNAGYVFRAQRISSLYAPGVGGTR